MLKYSVLLGGGHQWLLMGCNWSPFLSANFEMDSALSCLNNNLQLGINQLAPLKTVNPKHKQPWINSELQSLISKRKATEKRYLCSKNITLLNELMKLSDARNVYYREHIADVLSSNKDIWQELSRSIENP